MERISVNILSIKPIASMVMGAKLNDMDTNYALKKTKV